MTTLVRIQEAAMRRFAVQGYAGTSLSEIAADCGIKKPSIYTHFRSKRDLFRTLMEKATHEELAFATGQILRNTPVPEALEGLLTSAAERFGRTASLRFWIQALYLPPRELAQEAERHGAAYYEGMKSALETVLGKEIQSREGERSLLIIAYLGILKGLYAELLLGNKQTTDITLSALWSLFLRAMRS